jgi:hypothetical protein
MFSGSALYAPYSRLGNPDDLKYLVDQLHQAGFSVFVDFVPAHFVKVKRLLRVSSIPCFVDVVMLLAWNRRMTGAWSITMASLVSNMRIPARASTGNGAPWVREAVVHENHAHIQNHALGCLSTSNKWMLLRLVKCYVVSLSSFLPTFLLPFLLPSFQFPPK